MRFAAITLVIAGCAHWQEITVDDVRSGRVSFEHKWLEVDVPGRSIEMRSAQLVGDHVVGRARNGGHVDVPLADLIAARVRDDVGTRNALLGALVGFAIVGGLFFLYVHSQQGVN